MTKQSKYPVIDGNKKCFRCKRTLPVEMFRVITRPKTGTRSYDCYCKKCHARFSQKWDEAHPGKSSQRTRMWQRANREHYLLQMFRYRLRAKYKITTEEYQRLAGNPPRCGICGCEESSLKQRLGIDHCHSTQAVRGVLCKLCNHAIERLDTIPDWLTKAQQYLQRSKE